MARTISPQPGARVTLDQRGDVVFTAWNIADEGPDEDPSDRSRMLAILAWLAAQVMIPRELGMNNTTLNDTARVVHAKMWEILSVYRWPTL